MTINTLKEMLTGDCNPSAGNAVHRLVSSVAKLAHKTSSTLPAVFTFKGQNLDRTDLADRPATYWVERWRLRRYLATIDTTRRFLEQIGGWL